MGFLPVRKSRQWLVWFLAYGLLLSLLLGVNRFVSWNKEFDAGVSFRLALLGFGLAAIVNFIGWLGGRIAWLLATVGIYAGIAAMFLYSYRQMDGWGDLAGFLSFLLLAVGGMAAGLIAEGIRLAVVWRRGSR